MSENFPSKMGILYSLKIPRPAEQISLQAFATIFDGYPIIIRTYSSLSRNWLLVSIVLICAYFYVGKIFIADHYSSVC